MYNPFKGWHPSWTTNLEELEKEKRSKLKSKWALAFNHRGYGNGDYAIVTMKKRLFVTGPLELEVAEHIIDLHNKEIR